MKRKIGALEKVDADLPNLQHKIKIDPSSYRDDFVGQFTQYESLVELFRQSPTTTGSNNNDKNDDTGVVRLRDLIDFIAHVADCYPTLTTHFAADLIQLLEEHHHQLNVDLRDKIVGSLVLLRKKDVVDSTTLLNTLWPLLIATNSQALRKLLFQKIVSELRTSNSKTKNHKLNRMMQTVCYNLIAADPAAPTGLWSVKLTRELWKRQIWTDAKAVSVMEIAARSRDAKVVTAAVRFFLGADREREEAANDDSDDDEQIDMGKLRHQQGINKKTQKRENEIRAAAARVKRRERKKNAQTTLNFSALHLLNDPQGFAEDLFSLHLQPAHPPVKLVLEQKLYVLQLVARLVGLHKLTLIPLYSYFIKYLTPKQPSVTNFLASLAQSTHNLVPPDVLEPLVQKIANEFVSEAAASEVASAGLNGIREICVRQPLAMTDTLLQDLVQYRKSKDKGVQMAARGLLSLYQKVAPTLLRKRDRGKVSSMGLQAGQSFGAKFGEVEGGGIEGIELLEKWREEQGIGSDDDEEAWRRWEAESDDSESSGGWVNVESDGEEINVSDSEDERDTKPPPREDDGDTALAREEARVSNLATTRLLTPADHAKLNELRALAALDKSQPSAKRRKLELQRIAAQAARHADDEVQLANINGLALLSHKMTREEKIRHAKEKDGDEDPQGNDHRSSAARRQEKKRAEGKSTTNREKARKKNFLMTIGKAKRKGKRSLVEEKRILKAHVERGKRGGKRGNAGTSGHGAKG